MGFFDYKKEELCFRITTFEKIKKASSKNIQKKNKEVILDITEVIGEKQPKRKSIQLSKVNWEEERTFCMRTLKELKKENKNDTKKI